MAYCLAATSLPYLGQNAGDSHLSDTIYLDHTAQYGLPCEVRPDLHKSSRFNLVASVQHPEAPFWAAGRCGPRSCSRRVAKGRLGCKRTMRGFGGEVEQTAPVV